MGGGEKLSGEPMLEQTVNEVLQRGGLREGRGEGARGGGGKPAKMPGGKNVLIKIGRGGASGGGGTGQMWWSIPEKMGGEKKPDGKRGARDETGRGHFKSRVQFERGSTKSLLNAV